MKSKKAIRLANQKPVEIADLFSTFISRLESGVEAYRACNLEEDKVENFLVLISEAKILIRILEPYLPSGPSKILEIGCGAGILSFFLAEIGYEVVAVEPSEGVFSSMASLRTLASKFLAYDSSSHGPIFVDSTAEEYLAANADEAFDLIFSFNVLEHIPDYKTVLFLSDKALSGGGIQLHTFPNYSFPYEPHLGLILLPFARKLTRRLFPKDIRQSPTWDALYFITIRSVVQWSRRNSIPIEQLSNLMGTYAVRATGDQEFSDRHRTLSSLIRVVGPGGVLTFIRLLPRFLRSPNGVVMLKRSMDAKE